MDKIVLQIAAELKAGLAYPEAFTSGSQWAFWMMAGLAVASLAATLIVIRRDDLVMEGEAVMVSI